MGGANEVLGWERATPGPSEVTTEGNLAEETGELPLAHLGAEDMLSGILAVRGGAPGWLPCRSASTVL